VAVLFWAAVGPRNSAVFLGVESGFTPRTALVLIKYFHNHFPSTDFQGNFFLETGCDSLSKSLSYLGKVPFGY
jgi:hypothetical protein